MRTHALLIAAIAVGASGDNLHSMLAKTMSGEVKSLADFAGKPVLMVNVASR